MESDRRNRHRRRQGEKKAVLDELKQLERDRHRRNRSVIGRFARCRRLQEAACLIAVAAGLPYLHQALLVRGHPGGLHVTLQDGERISATNCVRQPFSKSEIALHKSVVLVNRLNIFWGLDWEAVPEHLVGDHPITQIDIIIGCVDSRAARAVIHRCATQSSTAAYWLDIGNNADSGQFILGEPLNLANPRRRTRLRSVAELYPEVIDAALDDDSLPSCSAAEALERQEPFVNATLANHALSLLAQLFRYGRIAHHGGFVNLSTGTATALRIDPRLWRRIQRRRDLRVFGKARPSTAPTPLPV